MTNSIIFYIIIAVVVSLILAGFQYLYKNKQQSNTKWLLFILRFFSLFGLLLLLINPKFKKNTIKTIKPNLVLLVDNSKSIKTLNKTKEIVKIVTSLKTHKALNNKFAIQVYPFAEDVSQYDSLFFKANETNIYQSLQSVEKLFKKTISPIILISDGNQTVGMNYANFHSKQTIYPIVVGDTTTYQDLKINQLNVNKYAYLKHKFPIEVFINYDGNLKNIPATFTIKSSNQTVFTKKITIGKNNSVVQLSFHLPANNVGVQSYEASVSYLKNEKNTTNNSREFNVEIINEQSKILLVSNIKHPDVAMFKRSIESNKQRKIHIVKPTDSFVLANYQMAILYQPTPNFKSIFEKLKNNNKNFLIVTGSKTDWNFLNTHQNYFSKKAISKTEDYNANYNTSFAGYQTEDLGFSNFSPVTDYFGDITFSIPYETILQQQIGNYPSKQPLLATFELGRRGAVLFGEHSWRWRMSSYIEKKSFQSYDDFMNKLIQYLASNKRSNLLEVDHKKYFYANESVTLKAQYFDANYQFDPNVKLWVNLTNTKTRKQLKYPFALKQNVYEVNITNLPSGNYKYTVSNESKKNVVKGSFAILSYNMEEQFVSANKKGLQELALMNNGEVIYTNQIEQLIAKLSVNKQFVAIQKSKTKTTPLIDWKYLLSIIITLLSVEWFIRKFKGYI